MPRILQKTRQPLIQIRQLNKPRNNRLKPNIWLLSAYRSASHAAWADWLCQQFPQFQWHKRELPGRHFRWRIRGNPLSWLHQLPRDAAPDLIIATSMVDLATLKGLHPEIAHVPCVYYFHENQFAYPSNDQQHPSIDPQMVQLYGALSADYCVFNSQYNQTSFLQGVDALLKQLPDEVPSGVVEQLDQKSSVLAVPVTPVKIEPHEKTLLKNPLLILWNHRWEYDKNPETFYNALIKLKQSGTDFKLALLGERPTKTPAILLRIENQLGEHILYNARVSRQEYIKILTQSSIVVSTAIHEFQGLSIIEAVSAGAIPLVPDDLCYPEQYDQQYLYPAGNSELLASRLTSLLTNNTNSIIAPDVNQFFNEKLINNWLELIQPKF